MITFPLTRVLKETAVGPITGGDGLHLAHGTVMGFGDGSLRRVTAGTVQSDRAVGPEPDEAFGGTRGIITYLRPRLRTWISVWQRAWKRAGSRRRCNCAWWTLTGRRCDARYNHITPRIDHPGSRPRC